MVSTVTINEYAESLRSQVADPYWGFTPEQQAAEVASYTNRMYLFRDRIVVVDWLPIAEGVQDECWTLTRNRGSAMDPAQYVPYERGWGSRAHVASHVLFNLKWTFTMFAQVSAGLSGKMDVAHLCVGRRFCVNPTHLEWQDAATNRRAGSLRRAELHRARRAAP